MSLVAVMEATAIFPSIFTVHQLKVTALRLGAHVQVHVCMRVCLSVCERGRTRTHTYGNTFAPQRRQHQDSEPAGQRSTTFRIL